MHLTWLSRAPSGAKYLKAGHRPARLTITILSPVAGVIKILPTVLSLLCANSVKIRETMWLVEAFLKQ